MNLSGHVWKIYYVYEDKEKNIHTFNDEYVRESKPTVEEEQKLLNNVGRRIVTFSATDTGRRI
jgi:hypothetical protein